MAAKKKPVKKKAAAEEKPVPAPAPAPKKRGGKKRAAPVVEVMEDSAEGAETEAEESVASTNG